MPNQDMHTTEVRRNKTALFLILVLLVAGWIGVTYLIYFSGALEATTELNILHVVVSVMMAYWIFKATSRLSRNEPVLIFTNSDLTINTRGNPQSFPWLQITEWDIEYDDGGEYLSIKTADKKKKIGISWLDKKSQEIRQLMNEYGKK